MTRKQKMAEFEQGYNIVVSGRHVHVTEAMKAYAKDKLEKLDRFGDRIIDIIVTMDIQKLEHKVDMVLKYGHTLIKSHGSSTDMYVSIDQAVNKLQAQLVKYKSRLNQHYAKGYPIIDVPVTIYGPPEEAVTDEEVDLYEVNGAIEEATKQELENSFKLHTLVRVESQPLKILTKDEAIMKMELSGAPFMVYRGEENRKLEIIYRLEDGNFGIIEPEA
ncbi:MAG: ribosome-associated translation inhibitor RaiA [Verrucomicrobia bacterium]|nr:ribosome-associated translation inhibitor RaiA [Verrucomicrobiota bacterium]